MFLNTPDSWVVVEQVKKRCDNIIGRDDNKELVSLLPNFLLSVLNGIDDRKPEMAHDSHELHVKKKKKALDFHATKLR